MTGFAFYKLVWILDTIHSKNIFVGPCFLAGQEFHSLLKPLRDFNSVWRRNWLWLLEFQLLVEPCWSLERMRHGWLVGWVGGPGDPPPPREMQQQPAASTCHTTSNRQRGRGGQWAADNLNPFQPFSSYENYGIRRTTIVQL